jgi:hypothetical protein
LIDFAIPSSTHDLSRSDHGDQHNDWNTSFESLARSRAIKLKNMELARFQAAIAAFDRLNAEDPNVIEVAGNTHPRELVQAERLSAWIDRIEPNASLALRLAARCQHLMRWKIKRSDFPEGRSGYHRWRRRAMEFHATEAARVLAELGFEPSVIADVKRINSKQELRENADVQTMEDALCLSFIEHELDEFATKHDDQKLSRILAETWRKISPRGRKFAPELLPKLSERVRELLIRTVHSS